MSIFTQKTKKSMATEVPSAEPHGAALVAMVDLGTHREIFKNEGKPDRAGDVRKLLLVWELTDAPMSGMKDTNHVLAKQYTLSLGQKAALRKLIDTWRGKKLGDDEDFDLKKLLGAKCMINVSHGESSKGNTYANIESIGPVPKGLKVADPRRTPFAWEFGSDQPCPPLEWVPWIYGEKVEDIMGRSHEGKGARKLDGQEQADAEEIEEGDRPEEEDIPF